MQPDDAPSASAPPSRRLWALATTALMAAGGVSYLMENPRPPRAYVEKCPGAQAEVNGACRPAHWVTLAARVYGPGEFPSAAPKATTLADNGKPGGRMGF